jgi:hypothetical protein
MAAESRGNRPALGFAGRAGKADFGSRRLRRLLRHAEYDRDEQPVEPGAFRTQVTINGTLQNSFADPWAGTTTVSAPPPPRT